MQEYQNFFNFLEFLAEIPDSEIAHFKNHISIKRLSKGDTLIEPGQKVQTVYWVSNGLLKTYFLEPDGSCTTKGFVWENHLASPYAAILARQPANFGVIALEETTCVAFEYSTVESLYKRHMCWQEIGRKIAEALFIDRENRIYHMLMNNAEERYKAFLNDFKVIANRIPQYEVASYIGITSVALSRIRSRRKSKKLDPAIGL